jgi:very-short-patch-repair endonuclease
VKKNEANLVMETHLRELGLSFLPEYRFCERQWKFDYVLQTHGSDEFRIAVEIEGGVGYFKNPKGQVIRGGRHSREAGYRSDLEKYRMASALGYKLFRFSTIEVLNGTAKEFIKKWA